MFKAMLSILIAGPMILSGCKGLTKSEENKTGNAFTVLNFSGEKTVEELGITIRRLKVWKSKDNDDFAGTSTEIDNYNIEIWFDLEGDNEKALENASDNEKENGSQSEEEKLNDDKKYRYKLISNLRANENGNLYAAEAEPGTTFYMTPSVTPLTSEGILSYTVTEEDGLISEKFPAINVYSEVTGASGSEITIKELLKAHEVDDSSWSSVYKYSMDAQIVSRVRYEQNEGFKTTEKLGCLIKNSKNGSLIEKTFLFDDVELGTLLQNSKDDLDSSSTPDLEKLGDDDELWIKWNEAWYITGLNLKSKSLRVMRSRYAPFYTARELPGVDSSDSKPSPSGFEALIKACNKKAGTSGSFRLLHLSTSNFLTPTLNAGSSNAYCSSLVNADSGSLNYSSATYDVCGFSITGAAAGTFNGTAHSGPIASAGSAAMHVEMSEPTDVQF